MNIVNGYIYIDTYRESKDKEQNKEQENSINKSIITTIMVVYLGNYSGRLLVDGILSINSAL